MTSHMFVKSSSLIKQALLDMTIKLIKSLEKGHIADFLTFTTDLQDPPTDPDAVTADRKQSFSKHRKMFHVQTF